MWYAPRSLFIKIRYIRILFGLCGFVWITSTLAHIAQLPRLVCPCCGIRGRKVPQTDPRVRLQRRRDAACRQFREPRRHGGGRCPS